MDKTCRRHGGCTMTSLPVKFLGSGMLWKIPKQSGGILVITKRISLVPEFSWPGQVSVILIVILRKFGTAWLVCFYVRDSVD